jgi:hypothetical protein
MIPSSYNYRPPDQLLTAAEHMRLRDHLATHHGLTAAQLDAAVGANPGGHTRRQVADLLKAWLRTRPKGP